MDTFRRPPQRDSWFAPLSIDLVLKVLYVTFLHPFVAWMVPLCFRAETMGYDAVPMRVSIVYASLVTVGWVLSAINRRMAFGLPREVDPDDEVIVITGGASGLGLLIAEVYGMRGASVAVLDINEMENGEARGGHVLQVRRVGQGPGGPGGLGHRERCEYFACLPTSVNVFWFFFSRGPTQTPGLASLEVMYNFSQGQKSRGDSSEN